MKVFLGGTCNGSDWRNRIATMLDIEYFNPVVEDWTPECMAEELRQRELCDLCLYVITPKMTGVYSVAEVVDDSNKRPSKTVFVSLRDDGDKRFSEGQWKSLGALAKMLERNGVAVFSDLKSCAVHMNSTQSKNSGVVVGASRESLVEQQYKEFSNWCRENPQLELDPRLHTHSGSINHGGYISHRRTSTAFKAWQASR